VMEIFRGIKSLTKFLERLKQKVSIFIGIITYLTLKNIVKVSYVNITHCQIVTCIQKKREY